MRRLTRSFLVLVCCLTAAAWPALAGATTRAEAATPAELREQANEAAARYSRARAEYDRLRREVDTLEGQVRTLEERMAGLREATTRGAAALYKRDSIVDSVSGFGDAEAALNSARRLRLVGDLNDLAGDAVEALANAARELRTQRVALEERRNEQHQAAARIMGERRSIEGRLAAMARAERDDQRRRRSEQRAREQAQRAAAGRRPAAAEPPAAVVPRVRIPGRFICPIDGPVAFSDDFGGRRNHKGNDLMNPRGTPNVAVVAGMMDSRPWGGGAGLTVFLDGDDGTTYIYMHLLEVVGPEPRRVEQGEVIGRTGKTGNATAYHTHFEVRPGGGAAVNPYPLIAAHC